MTDSTLISLIGPPASGKTTVARWLAEALGAELILEDYAGNPFLADSYAGRDDLRLAGQVWFMLSRVDQLSEARWTEGRTAVSDYAFSQDRIYAEIRLSEAELPVYASLAARVAPLVREPDVLIHLDGPIDLLRERIGRRGRAYEAFFTIEFLERQRRAYAGMLAETSTPVLSVDIAECDLALPERRRWLLGEVERLRAGRSS